MQPNQSTENLLDQFRSIMQREQIPSLATEIFSIYYRQLSSGNTYFIEESDIEPLLPDDIVHLATLNHYAEAGTRALARCAVIKLNGGLGTTMGLKGPKSLVPVKNGRTFLEITLAHLQSLRQSGNVPLPLLLMNSFHTHQDTLAAIKTLASSRPDAPISFLQHRFPRIDQECLTPITCSAHPTAEWSPPGHGDLYAALVTSGLLDQLIDNGIEFAFVSNIDNCGATPDRSLLGYVAESSIPFLMEVIKRTPRDNKGGHLAKRKQGGLILRELAQCPPAEHTLFGDIKRYNVFNTNNLWINLAALKKLLSDHDNRLPLPLIANKKNVDTDQGNRPVIQLESAAGAAIVHFTQAKLVMVESDRFAPVKTCGDLLRAWSDCYRLESDFRLIPQGNRPEPVAIALDERYYGSALALQEHFPAGAPSLINCSSLTVIGDITFGRNITIRGAVTLRNNSATAITIADNRQFIDQDIILA